MRPRRLRRNPDITDLRRELERLQKLLPGIRDDISRAREHGDLRENAEYQEARERDRNTNAQINEIARQIAAEAARPELSPQEESLLGKVVVFTDVDFNRTRIAQFVEGSANDPADVFNCVFSVRSPLGSAMAAAAPLRPKSYIRMISDRSPVGGGSRSVDGVEEMNDPILRTFVVEEVLSTRPAPYPDEVIAAWMAASRQGKMDFKTFIGGEKKDGRFGEFITSRQAAAAEKAAEILDQREQSSQRIIRIAEENERLGKIAAQRADARAAEPKENSGRRRVRSNPVVDMAVVFSARELSKLPQRKREEHRRHIEALLFGSDPGRIAAMYEDFSHENLERLLYLLTAAG